MATIEAAGATVGYAVEGDGVPLLLIHGTTMNRTGWDMVRAAMPAGAYRYVALELPGSGESSVPAAPITMDSIVGQALAVMDHLQIDRFHVAGYSLGAVIALAIAGTAPERVTSVTSLCGWAASDARQRITFGLWKELIATSPELFTRYALADGFTVGALSQIEPMLEVMVGMGPSLVAPGSAMQLDLDIALDISSLLPAITSPALIIGATDDRWVDVSHSRALHAAIGGSRLVELPAGHLVIQELAADVAALVHDHVGAS